MAVLFRRLLALCVSLALFAAGCTGSGAAHPVTIGQCAQDCSPDAATPAPAPAISAATSVAAASASAAAVLTAGPAGFARVSPAPSARAVLTPNAVAGFANGGSATPAGCTYAAFVQQTLATLTPAQQVGQLFMVGLNSSDTPDAVLATIANENAGNVVLYGTGWSSADLVAGAAASIQNAATAANGVGAFIAGNQEGGEAGSFQAFYGPGFDPIPAALQQGALSPATLQARAQTWGQQLRAAGVNLDLAPVLDVVDHATAQQNGPIGQYDREFGFDPTTVAKHGVAFIGGMQVAGVAVAIKHFPGLGRVQGNTDFTAQGTVDNQLADASDANLQPFTAGIKAGADMVMVGSATYPNFPQPSQQTPGPALFSPEIVTGLLRQTLGFGGVVISDDVGAAASVADYSAAQRATLFFRAGGDMLLTVQPADIAPMTAAVLALMSSDAGFAQQIQQSLQRVLTLKAQYGLLPVPRSCAAPAATGTPGQGNTRAGR